MISKKRIKLLYPSENDGCSECGNLVTVHDCRTGDQICIKCGIVQEERIIGRSNKDLKFQIEIRKDSV